MSKPKRPESPDSNLMSQAADMPNPADIQRPSVPVMPLAGIPLGLAVFRKTSTFDSPSKSWQRMHDAVNTRDKALEKYTAAWYDTSEGKKLEEAARQATADYHAERRRVS